MHQFPVSRIVLRRGVLCLVAALFPACDKHQETPDWHSQRKVPSVELAKAAAASPEKQVQHSNGEETNFMVYNLHNYISTPREKPEKEINALLNHIQKVSPDIIGICEIGGAAELSDLKNRLQATGLHYPHKHRQSGADTRRQLAILSRYPLTSHSEAKLTYLLNGKNHKMLRGILDVEIDLPFGKTRFVGVHLKSKRPSKFWDQARIRRCEAHLVRKHINQILKEKDIQLVLYGDFNDTKQSPSVRTMAGSVRSANYLKALNPKASDGSNWTHHWKQEDVYSRFDYCFISKSMNQHIVPEKSYILDIHVNDPASDHRPLVITFR